MWVLTTKRHEKARKFYRVVASTDELAPAKFLCAKDKDKVPEKNTCWLDMPGK